MTTEPPDGYQLAPQLDLLRDHYLRIESDLRELLAAAAPDPGVGLLAQSTYLALLSRFIYESRLASMEAAAAGPEFNEPLIEGFRNTFGAPDERGKAWGRILAIAEKPRYAPRLRRSAIGFVTAMRRQAEGPEARRGGTLGGVIRYLAQAFGSGTLEMPGGGGRISFKLVERVRIDCARGEFADRLGEIINEWMNRNELLDAENVRMGHHLFLLRYGLIQAYGAGFAALDGRSEVSAGDLDAAVDEVESFYRPTSPEFEKMFDARPRLRGVFEGILQRPGFPFAMVFSRPKE